MQRYQLNILASLFLLVFANSAFFHNLAQAYPATPWNVAFMVSLGSLLAGLTLILLTLLDSKHTIRPLLIVVLLTSALAAAAMDSYNVIIDSDMIANILQTDRHEAMDLVNPRSAARFLLLGVLPAVFVSRVNLIHPPLRRVLAGKLKVILVTLLVIAAQLPLFGSSYASFSREHKPLRYYSNRLSWIWSSGKYLAAHSRPAMAALQPVGTDAVISPADHDRELVILVLGETLRADHLSLNGYARVTNPLLAGQDVISLGQVSSCGTSTAASVPCIFLSEGRADYHDGSIASEENLLDVLRHAGVSVLWRDNNSGSKGVADRVEYQDFRDTARNPACDSECRDEGMLAGLQDYIDGRPDGDILVVLHQMGSHGPAYYKRYPPAFERFTPACGTSELEDCSEEEITNAYDNTALYTDYFLSRVIELLRGNDAQFETALLYLSDHGESLGEHGVYLHGLPYLLAPEAQTHVPLLLWFGKHYDAIDREALRALAGQPYSHDNIFHTVLGLFEVETAAYDSRLDITFPARR
jgi:lipid A ethanolaminephosphotransferase